jgi:putative transposase
MSRPLRVEYPGAFYHVINRGNAGENIFQSSRDREKFLEYLENFVGRFSIIVHTYCLMTNHFHLLLETRQPNLSKAIQWINVSYATYFNRKHNRRGHLFQGRFKSVLIGADEYLKHLSRYIHLNPVRAKMVRTPSEHKWSSYSAFIGKVKKPEWLETEWLLSQFGKREKAAERNYKDFVEGVKVDEIENPAKELIGGFILGNQVFANWVKRTFLIDRLNDREVPQLRRIGAKIDPETVVEHVAREFGWSREGILKKGKKRNTARDVAIYLSRKITGEGCRNLGEFFNGISGAGITGRYNRISDELRKDKRLRTKIDKISKQIINN